MVLRREYDVFRASGFRNINECVRIELLRRETPGALFIIGARHPSSHLFLFVPLAYGVYAPMDKHPKPPFEHVPLGRMRKARQQERRRETHKSNHGTQILLSCESRNILPIMLFLLVVVVKGVICQ